jgi:glycine/D-amino acid oxidase-like deaminating enzyme
LKVVVVGAGIIGSAIAFRLAQAGQAVTLVEAASAGSGATGSSFAWVNARHKQPRHYFDLSFEGIAAHRRLATELQDTSWWVPTGGLQWVDSDDPEVAANIELRRSWGYCVETLPRGAAAKLEPDLLFEDHQQFAFYPDEGFVFGRTLVGTLIQAGRDHGITELLGCRVNGFETIGGRIVAVRIEPKGVLDADAVVICGGHRSGQLSDLVGVPLPIVGHGEVGATGTGTTRGIVGMLAITEQVPANVRRVIQAPGLQFRPDGGGRLLLQDTAVESTVTADTPEWPPPPQAAELLARVRRLVRYLDGASLERVQVATRPLTRDGLPIVGWLPHVKGVYVAVTHSGITLGPLLGELVAREIVHEESTSALEGFRPDRFGTAA